MTLENILTRLHIVIPVFNGWLQTKRCLESLRKSTCQDFRVIVVDHGSTDETKQELRTMFPEVKCVLGDESLWWTGATNLGIRQAIAVAANPIMLLNNDCYMAPDAIGKLLTYSDNCGDNCIVAPLTTDMITGKVLNLGYTTCLLLGFPSIRMPTMNTQSVLESGGVMPTRLIMGGRGVIIPTSIFQRIGLFDEENFPHYLADHDFYLRCKKAGIRLMIATDAQLVVDNTRTTIADNLASKNFSAFRETWYSKKSHRNHKDLTAFFKKYYPIKSLYPIGVGMNFARYLLSYTVAKIIRFYHTYLRKK